jgi:hypothetical protein
MHHSCIPPQRTFSDILMKEQLEEWRSHSEHPVNDVSSQPKTDTESIPEFRVVYCVGSRFDHVIMGGKTKNPTKPPAPAQMRDHKNAELVRLIAVVVASICWNVYVCEIVGLGKRGQDQSPRLSSFDFHQSYCLRIARSL